MFITMNDSIYKILLYNGFKSMVKLLQNDYREETLWAMCRYIKAAVAI